MIRSIFHNRVNESIIVVSVTKKDEYNSLKCRTVAVSLIEQAFNTQAQQEFKAAANPEEASTSNSKEDTLQQFMNGKHKGMKLFQDFSLRWPDFIEFDEINQKIITKHSSEDAYRVWSLQTYQL